MSLLTRIRSLKQNLLDKDRVEQELDDEVRGYVEMLTDEKIRSGADPQRARREALIELGGIEQVKETTRDVKTGALLESLLFDFRYSLRTLFGSRGFTIVALMSVALGAGSAAAMFSVIQNAVIRPLAYSEPDRLVRVTHFYPKGAVAAMQAESRTVDFAGFTTDSEFNIVHGGETTRVPGSAVSVGLFPLLGVTAQLGRAFSDTDDRSPNDRIVVLSDRIWQSLFQRDPAILGKILAVDGVERTVIGIMPPDFEFPTPTVQLWAPLRHDPTDWVDHWAAGFMPLIARLRPGVTLQQANDEIRGLVSHAISNFPYSMARSWNRDAEVVPLRQALARDVRPQLLVLVSAVGIVLTISFVNLAMLLLSRGARRRKEMAVRASLGASPQRLIRQLVIEGATLSAAGGVLGCMLALAILAAVRSVLPPNAPRLVHTSIDPLIHAGVATLVLIGGAVCGWASAWSVGKVNLAEAVNAGGPRTTPRGDARLRRSFIAGEVALSAVLVICAGLLIKSLLLLTLASPGLRPEHIATARLYPSESSCADRASCVGLYDQALRQVRALTGVADVAAASAVPFGKEAPLIPAEFEGHPLQPAERVAPLIWSSAVTPDYFRIMRIPLIAGRGFTEADGIAAPGVLIVSARTAQHFWPGQNAIGKRVRPVWDEQWKTVIGVAADVPRYNLSRAISDVTDGVVYMPYPQSIGLDRRIPAAMTLVVRTSADLSHFHRQLREQMDARDFVIPDGEVRTMEAVVSASTSQSRSMMLLFCAFAGAALLLVAIGVYGLVSYAVAQRRHEIAIRLALGAARTHIVALMLSQTMRHVAAGLALGLVAAVVLARPLTAFLYGVSSTDPATYGIVAVFVIVVATAAGYLPLRRAVMQEPASALHIE